MNEIAFLKKSLSDLTAERDELLKHIKRLNDEIKSLSEKVKKLDEIKHLQERLDEVERQKQDLIEKEKIQD